MKLVYLGTAASEGWPGVFCNCVYCKKARELGGKNLRTRSQSLINGDLLIDFPIDTYQHVLTGDFDLSAVKYCFFTHSHNDHCSPVDLFYRKESCYAKDMTEKEIHLYGNEAVLSRLEHLMPAYEEEEELAGVYMHLLKAYEAVEVGDYHITPLPANHAKRESAFVFLIENAGKTLLYLHDTGLLAEDVYLWLKEYGVRADVVSYDCTFGGTKSGGGHLGLDSVPVVKNRLEESGVSDKDTISVINHFSHNGKLMHNEMAEAAEKIGCLCAYDGMKIEF